MYRGSTSVRGYRQTRCWSDGSAPEQRWPPIVLGFSILRLILGAERASHHPEHERRSAPLPLQCHSADWPPRRQSERADNGSRLASPSRAGPAAREAFGERGPTRLHDNDYTALRLVHLARVFNSTAQCEPMPGERAATWFLGRRTHRATRHLPRITHASHSPRDALSATTACPLRLRFLFR